LDKGFKADMKRQMGHWKTLIIPNAARPHNALVMCCWQVSHRMLQWPAVGQTGPWWL
jgi:hypothetical protein